MGLESAFTLLEAGAKAVYCLDLPDTPGEEWQAVRSYAEALKLGELVYMKCDVTSQKPVWEIGEKIGDKEGRLDVCVAAAGIAAGLNDCLDCTGEIFQSVCGGKYTPCHHIDDNNRSIL